MKKPLMALATGVALCMLHTGTASAASTAVPSGTTSLFAAAQGGKDQATPKNENKNASKRKPTRSEPGAKGGNPPAHSNGKGRAQAPGQLKKDGTGASNRKHAGSGSGMARGSGSVNANPRSQNENKKITYCHVPPGNPDNGHVITTSVNAITPGHTNHSGDIIPPFSYVKHGKTTSFPGQNWGPDAQEIIDAGCKKGEAPVPGGVDESSGGGTGDPTTSGGAAQASKTSDGQLKDVSATGGAATEKSALPALLPDTGGARLALLLAGLGLLVGGGLLLARRRAAA
ncbi:LPXTG cell wall anchor domain-containing protein [Aeromicrobium sp. CTD01-1L150]|uniref:LPXTG cell wall anchor domain-containing protein n=1 Tax=Aeromicrobium sp. CTD01-1L150 TaxID=3341830 RepID=UPI0035C25E7D